MVQMRTAILTRFCYTDKVSSDRLQLLQTKFIDSLKKQTVKDFDIHVFCDELLGVKGHSSNLELVKSLDWEGLNVYFDKFEKFTYDIEVRLDSDDEVIPTFVSFLQDVATKEENVLVNFKPIKRVKGADYKHERDYNEHCTSMFIALIQTKEKTKCIHDRPHSVMGKHIGKVFTVKEGYCILNIHENNMTSKFLGNEIKY